MMPAAIAAMGMKFVSIWVLRRWGYRTVLVINTLMIGATIGCYSLVEPSTPIPLIVLMGLGQGFFNSLQFSSLNSMAYADIEGADSSMAATIASSLQQMALSFGLAGGAIVTAWFLGDLPQTDKTALIEALHYAFQTLAIITVISSASFWTLRPGDGASVSDAGVERK